MDVYVFTLLHELAHLTLGHLDKAETYVDENLDTSRDPTRFETAANQQASEWILPDFELPPGRPTMVTVLQIANKRRVHASLVIGRLQHELEDWRLLLNSIARVRPFVKIAS